MNSFYWTVIGLFTACMLFVIFVEVRARRKAKAWQEHIEKERAEEQGRIDRAYNSAANRRSMPRTQAASVPMRSNSDIARKQAEASPSRRQTSNESAQDDWSTSIANPLNPLSPMSIYHSSAPDPSHSSSSHCAPSHSSHDHGSSSSSSYDCGSSSSSSNDSSSSSSSDSGSSSSDW